MAENSENGEEQLEEIESDDEDDKRSPSSSSSGSSIPPGQFVPYSQRPEWSDVTPLPQDDGPDPVVRIAYSEEFREVYDYMRAMVATNEMSLRAFHLTTHALRLNPANYTVWEFRRRLIRNLSFNLHEEIEHMNSIIEKNPKNYQVWHHRRVLVEWLDDPKGELEFIEHIFDDSEDWKNFHAWQHRSWIVSHFKLTNQISVQKSELSFTKRLLDLDMRNNSVWNYRMFLLRKCFSDGKTLTNEVRQSEITMTLIYIRQVPDNESSWNYLLGLLDGTSVSDYPDITNLCKELHESGRLHQFSLDCEVSAIEDKLKRNDLNKENRRELVDRAASLLDLLKTTIDPIRARYWQYRKELLTATSQ